LANISGGYGENIAINKASKPNKKKEKCGIKTTPLHWNKHWIKLDYFG
jgi:hypothetical protein